MKLYHIIFIITIILILICCIITTNLHNNKTKNIIYGGSNLKSKDLSYNTSDNTSTNLLSDTTNENISENLQNKKSKKHKEHVRFSEIVHVRKFDKADDPLSTNNVIDEKSKLTKDPLNTIRGEKYVFLFEIIQINFLIICIIFVLFILLLIVRI